MLTAAHVVRSVYAGASCTRGLAARKARMRHGHCNTNSAEGAMQLNERKRHGMPTRDGYDVVLKFART